WRQQAVDLKWSIMSGDYPHLAPGVDIKALLRLMGGPFSASATHTHLLSTLLLTYIPTTRIHASLRTPRLFSSINHFVVNKYQFCYKIHRLSVSTILCCGPTSRA